MSLSALPTHFARWVLVWFGLTLCVAILGPAKPAFALEPICTSAGMVWVNPSADNAPASANTASGLHCILCSPLLTPQRAERLPEPSPAPNLRLPRPPDLVVLAWHARAPMPSRGPPSI